MITQKDIKERLYYCPNTGVFRRKVDMSEIGTKSSIGYIVISVDRKLYYAHRLAWLYMTGKWPKQIDHINHVRDDNRWVNIRESSQQENCKNMPKHKDNTSGVTGVAWDKSRGNWIAQIQANRKKRYLGRFKDKFEAICARKSAESKYGFHENHGRYTL